MDRPRRPKGDDDKSYDMGGGIALILAVVFIPILVIDFVAMIWLVSHRALACGCQKAKRWPPALAH
jgi:hypothetical protein